MKTKTKMQRSEERLKAVGFQKDPAGGWFFSINLDGRGERRLYQEGHGEIGFSMTLSQRRVVEHLLRKVYQLGVVHGELHVRQKISEVIQFFKIE